MRGFTGFLRLLCFVGIAVNCTSCMTSPDCYAESHVVVQGEVRDSMLQPIEDAEIIIQSAEPPRCPGFSPTEEIRLKTDKNGKFSTIILSMANDEVLRMSVSAEGFKTNIQYGKAAVFSLQFDIILERT